MQPDLSQADISVFSSDIVQLVDVILTYAGGHRETLYGALDEASGVNITPIRFDYLALEEIFAAAPNTPDAKKWMSWEAEDWSQITVAQRSRRRNDFKFGPSLMFRSKNVNEKSS